MISATSQLGHRSSNAAPLQGCSRPWSEALGVPDSQPSNKQLQVSRARLGGARSDRPLRDDPSSSIAIEMRPEAGGGSAQNENPRPTLGVWHRHAQTAHSSVRSPNVEFHTETNAGSRFDGRSLNASPTDSLTRGDPRPQAIQSVCEPIRVCDVAKEHIQLSHSARAIDPGNSAFGPLHESSVESSGAFSSRFNALALSGPACLTGRSSGERDGSREASFGSIQEPGTGDETLAYELQEARNQNPTAHPDSIGSGPLCVQLDSVQTLCSTTPSIQNQSRLTGYADCEIGEEGTWRRASLPQQTTPGSTSLAAHGTAQSSPTESGSVLSPGELYESRLGRTPTTADESSPRMAMASMPASGQLTATVGILETPLNGRASIATHRTSGGSPANEGSVEASTLKEESTSGGKSRASERDQLNEGTNSTCERVPVRGIHSDGAPPGFVLTTVTPSTVWVVQQRPGPSDAPEFPTFYQTTEPEGNTTDSAGISTPCISSTTNSLAVRIDTKISDPVVLHFLGRQGRVDIRMKSPSLRSAEALFEGLEALEGSLSHEGWSVDSKTQLNRAVTVRLLPHSNLPTQLILADRCLAATSLRTLISSNAEGIVEGSSVQGESTRLITSTCRSIQSAAVDMTTPPADLDASTPNSTKNSGAPTLSESREHRNPPNHSRQSKDEKNRNRQCASTLIGVRGGQFSQINIPQSHHGASR